MKVRTDAWHYKVWAWSHLEKADFKQLEAGTSLCPYFWRVMLALVWLPPAVILLLLGKICFVPLKCHLTYKKIKKGMFHPFHSFEEGQALGEGFLGLFSLLVFLIICSNLLENIQKFGSIELLKGFLYFMAFIASLFALGVFIVLLFFGLRTAYDKLNEWKNSPAGNQSLLLSYLSAVKLKVCPTINFVDKV